jgi:predicted Zn-dependent peptidase
MFIADRHPSVYEVAMKLYTANHRGLRSHTLATAKFKSIVISLRFIAPFRLGTINQRALLPEILLGATKKYPSRQLLKRKLDGLYGMEIGSQTQKIGMQSVISFDLSFVSGNYLPGNPDLLREAFILLREVVFNPKLVKGQFMNGLFELEKRNLYEDLEASYHDKTAYSYLRFTKIMFQNELFGLSPRGELDSLPLLSRDQLLLEYKSLIDSDLREIYVVGDVDPKVVDELADQYFSGAPGGDFQYWIDQEGKKIESLMKVIEYGELNQSRVIIGYRTVVKSDSPLFFPMLVLNTILGDGDQAKLFLSIREDQGLSYDIQTSYSGNKGVLLVFAGVDKDQEESVVAQVDDVIWKMSEDSVTISDLKIAKEQLQKGVRESADSPGSLIDRIFINLHLHGRDVSVSEIIRKIEDVKVIDVIRARDTLVKDTIYIFRDGGDE